MDGWMDGGVLVGVVVLVSSFCRYWRRCCCRVCFLPFPPGHVLFVNFYSSSFSSPPPSSTSHPTLLLSTTTTLSPTPPPPPPHQSFRAGLFFLVQLGKLSTQDPSEWRTMFEVNVLGLLNVTRAVLPSMEERGTGTIVNVSSVAGIKAFPDHAAYCGTKFGVHGISETLREEVSGKNVRVCVISPGAVETELLSHTTDDSIKDGYEQWKENIGGAIAADDIASAIDYVVGVPQNVCIRELVIAATRQGP